MITKLVKNIKEVHVIGASSTMMGKNYADWQTHEVTTLLKQFVLSG